MSENHTNKDVRNDEIDLLDLFRRMGRIISNWAKAIGKALLFSIVFLIKRWFPLSLSLFLGIGVAYLLKTTSESFYTSDMVLRNNTVTNSDMMLYIGRLHNFCLEKNKASLAEALSLMPDFVKNIMDINSYWIIEDRRKGISGMVDYTLRSNSFDTVVVRMHDRIDIRVKIKSPQELSALQNALLAYINRDSLFQQRNRIRLLQNENLIARYNYDIEQLDTLQKRLIYEDIKNRKPVGGGQIIFLQETKTQLVYADAQTLLAKKLALESEKILYKDLVTVLNNFSLPAKPDNGTFYYGKKVIPVLFGITLLLLIILANRKRLKEVYGKY